MNVKSILRSIGAVVAGFATWTVLWLSSNAAARAIVPDAFDDQGLTSSTGILLFLLVASVVYSIVAGWVTAAVAGRAEVPHTVALGVVQTAIGIAVQLAYWDVMPLWYHLPFLALLLPGNVLGGWLRASRS
ncbi:MAG: hypothetical protein MPN21_07525 [Thermoanaerobaculia bacterium]|nr:hypothetical protein [Thermoanaerobaculia bacterium]